MENPNITIIPLSFDNAFIQVERGDLLEVTVDIGQGEKVAGPMQLSNSERDQLIIAMLQAPVSVDGDTENP